MATISNEAPYKEFAERLLGLRTKSGMTRAQLGEKCGISGRAIINYENGTRIPFGDTCAKMAEVFGITTDELLGVSNPDAEMAKAEAFHQMRVLNGSKGATRLRYHLDAASSALAGGDLSEDQMEEYVLEMQKMAMLAQQKLREIHTNKRFQATVDSKAVETEEAVKRLDSAIREIASDNH